MTIEQLRRMIHAEPFEPFVMHLADGGEVPVHHPEFIAVSPTGRTCVVWEDDSNAFGVVDLLLVTQLRVERNGKPGAKNKGGKKKRKRK